MRSRRSPAQKQDFAKLPPNQPWDGTSDFNVDKDRAVRKKPILLPYSEDRTEWQTAVAAAKRTGDCKTSVA